MEGLRSQKVAGEGSRFLSITQWEGGRNRSNSLPGPPQTQEEVPQLSSASPFPVSRLGTEKDALERMKKKKYYYRQLAGTHTLFSWPFLPGERTLLNDTKCIGFAMPNAAITVITGSLLVTNFRVVFYPSSSDEFLKVRTPGSLLFLPCAFPFSSALAA